MVNHGPSKRCKTCKARKIKCDEAKPFCTQCIKSHWPCEYPEFTRHERSHPSAVSLQKSIALYKERASGSRQHGFNAVPLGLPQCPEQQSLGYFMARFVPEYAHTELVMNNIQLLPAFYSEASPGSPISLAIETLAHECVATLDPANHHFHVLSKSRYIHALASTKDAVYHLGRGNSDHLIASICLLDVWEECQLSNHQPTARAAHVSGAAALVMALIKNPTYSKPSEVMAKGVQRRLRIWSIQNCNATAFETYRSVLARAYPRRKSTLQELHAEASSDLPRLRMDALSINRNDLDFCRKAIYLIEDAKELDRRLSSWVEHPTDDFKVTIRPTENTGNPEAPDWIYSYSHTAVALRWISWRLDRLRVLFIIQHFTSLLESHASAPPSIVDSGEYTAPIPHIIEDIYSMVPYDQATSLANQSLDAMHDSSTLPSTAQASLDKSIPTYVILRSLEVGTSISPVAGVKFANGRHLPWSREYIEAYARFPCATL